MADQTPLETALEKRDAFAKKVKALEAQTRYVAKALALANARLEAAEEIVEALKIEMTGTTYTAKR